MDPMLSQRVVMLLCLMSWSVCDPLPGLQLHLSQKGMDYAATVALDVLSHKVQGQRIPDQSGRTGTPIGKVDYTISGININSFGKPSSRVTIQAGKGIQWAASGASLSVHGDWRYKYKKWWIKISDHGSFDASVSSVDFTLSFTLGKDASGQPTISTTDSSSSVGDCRVRFHGGASWLYNIFHKKIEAVVKDQVQKIMRTAATDAVNKNANQELARLKMVVPIKEKALQVLLNYKLIAPPTFTSTFMQSLHKGEFFWPDDTSEAPFTPSAMPPSPGVSNMVQLWVSDYILNTLGCVLNKHGLIAYNLTPNDLDPKDRGYLNTTCSSLFGCIGGILPNVKTLYPNSAVEIAMKTSKSPVLKISTGGIEGHFEGYMNYTARLPNGKAVFLLATNLTVSTNLDVSLVNQKITAKVNQLKPSIQIMKSNIGKIEAGPLNLLFGIAAKTFILPKLNQLAAKGLPIPMLGDVALINSKLAMLQGALFIGTDIKYNPATLYFKRFNEV